jgi:hypothetical protein
VSAVPIGSAVLLHYKVFHICLLRIDLLDRRYFASSKTPQVKPGVCIALVNPSNGKALYAAPRFHTRSSAWRGASDSELNR